MYLKSFLLIIFILLSITNIISIKKGDKFWQHLTKPLLMPTLLLFYLFSTQAPKMLIIFALVFGFLGDVFLMGTGAFFTIGLFSFLTGHVFYIIALSKAITFSKIPVGLYFLIIPYVIYGAFVFKKLLPYLKAMKVQALLYLIIIITMSFTSLIRIGNVNSYQFWMPFMGSLLFISSDSMLAFNEFKSRSNIREVYVMITYVVAQLLIVLGFI